MVRRKFLRNVQWSILRILCWEIICQPGYPVADNEMPRFSQRLAHLGHVAELPPVVGSRQNRHTEILNHQFAQGAAGVLRTITGRAVRLVAANESDTEKRRRVFSIVQELELNYAI